MAVFLSPVGGAAAQFFDNDGVPLAGGLIYTYTAGTSTPAATYTTSSGLIQHSNPIILDAAGRVPTGEIWLADTLAYKFVIKTDQEVLIATYDNVTGINSNFIAYTSQQEIQTATAGQTVFNLTTMQYQPNTNNLSVFVDGVNQYGPGAQYAYVETDSETVTFVTGLHVGASVKFTTASPVASAVVNAENVAYTYPAGGAVTQNVEDRLAQYVSVKDFGAVGDGVTDDTVAIQNAIDAIQANGRGIIMFPATNSYYYITDTLSITQGDVSLKGDGAELSQILTDDPEITLLNIIGSAPGAAGHNSVTGLSFGRTVLPTPGYASKGIYTKYTVWSLFADVVSYNSAYCYWQEDGYSARYNGCLAFRTAQAVSSNDLYCGWNLVGSNFTSNYFQCYSIANTTDTGTAYSATSFGWFCEATDMRDIFLRECVSDVAQYGYWFDGKNTSNTNNWDIQFLNCTSDSFGTAGWQLQNFLYTTQISIVGGWSNPAVIGTSTSGITALNVVNLSVTAGHQFTGIANFDRHFGFYGYNLQNCVISGNTFNRMVNGILLEDDNLTGFTNGCIISSNSFFNDDVSQANYAVKIKNGSNCVISNNSVGGANAKFYNAYVLDGTAGGNTFIGNTMNGAAVVAPVNILSTGTGNKFTQNNTINPKNYFVPTTTISSNVEWVNETCYDVLVTIGGGAVSAIKINNVTTGLTSGAFFIPVGGAITVVWSVAPTITYQGM